MCLSLSCFGSWGGCYCCVPLPGGLGLADACLRLGAVRYFVSRLFDKFVRFCLCCFVRTFPHFICHVPLNKYRFVLKLLVRV